MYNNNSNKEKIIYSINSADVHEVAIQELGRKLTQNELKIIEDKIGDNIDWYESIISTINQNLNISKTNNI